VSDWPEDHQDNASFVVPASATTRTAAVLSAIVARFYFLSPVTVLLKAVDKSHEQQVEKCSLLYIVVS